MSGWRAEPMSNFGKGEGKTFLTHFASAHLLQVWSSPTSGECKLLHLRTGVKNARTWEPASGS